MNGRRSSTVAENARFVDLYDRLVAATGSPGLTSLSGGKVHMTLSEWERLIGFAEAINLVGPQFSDRSESTGGNAVKITKEQRRKLRTLAEVIVNRADVYGVEDVFDSLAEVVEEIANAPTPEPIEIVTKVAGPDNLHAKFTGPHPATSYGQMSIFAKTPGKSMDAHMEIARRLVAALELEYQIKIRPIAAQGSGYIFEVTPKDGS